jgi:hypothetical protein
MDPAIERLIERCLERDPQQRPHSVYVVLGALPGSDPLAAALAAGETPSPDLVANARDAGGLRPPIAIGLLVAMLGFLAITYFIHAGTTVMPQRSPAVLSVVAEQVMEERVCSIITGLSWGTLRRMVDESCENRRFSQENRHGWPRGVPAGRDRRHHAGRRPAQSQGRSTLSQLQTSAVPGMRGFGLP